MPTERAAVVARGDAGEADWLSATAAAALLGVSQRTIRRAIARGVLPAIKRAGIYRIAPDDLTRFRGRRGGGDEIRHLPVPPRLVPLPDPVPAPGIPPSFDLPRQLTPLIGRARELAMATAALRDGVRLLTLTGPGGVGKTRLAVALAETVSAIFPDGVWFVPLAPVHDPALVGATIAGALGVRETGERPLIVRLRAFLRDKQALLVLDNFEHVLVAAPFVTELLATCPRLAILTTSRAVLRLSGEHNLVVPSLALPDLTRPPALALLNETSAVRLFVARARAARDDFVLTDDNAAAVAQICHRLDGLPLAIELAAAWSRMLSPTVLLAGLERRLLLLTGGPRDVPARLRTMRDAIAWSHDLLSEEEQALFRHLAVFVGGFTLEAAGAVAGVGAPSGTQPEAGGRVTEHLATAGTGVPDSYPPAIIDGLSSLVDKSLIQFSIGHPGAPSGQSTRYGMLETIREFALEQLAGSSEEAATRRRHAAYFLAMAEEISPTLTGREQGPSFARVAADHDNLRAALRWAETSGETTTVLRLVVALWRFWTVRGHLQETQDLLERVIAAAEGGDVPRSLRAEAFYCLGRLVARHRDFARATDHLKEAVTVWEDLDDWAGVARATFVLGGLAESLGDDGRATAHYEAALALHRRLGDRRMTALTLENLADAAYRQGRIEQAAPLAEEALAASREIDDTAILVQAMGGAAQVACARGDLGGAGRLLREALTLGEALGFRMGIADVLSGCAALAAAGGQAERATRLLGAADAILTAIGEPIILHHAQRARTEAVARAALPAEEFMAAWSAGQTLEEAAAIAEAIAVTDDAMTAATTGTEPAPIGAPTAHAHLTPRELEVLRLLTEGRADKEIAAALGIARATATKHVEAIRGKLGLPSRSAAAAYAVRHGLV